MASSLRSIELRALIEELVAEYVADRFPDPAMIDAATWRAARVAARRRARAITPHLRRFADQWDDTMRYHVRVRSRRYSPKSTAD